MCFIGGGGIGMGSSIKTTQLKLQEVRRIKHLVKDMKKPNNFTYTDITTLYQQLEELENYLKKEIEDILW